LVPTARVAARLTWLLAVGVIIGFIFGKLARPPGTLFALRCLTCAGTVNIFRYGAGANGIMRTLGQYMLGSGATFG
jgi:hypothetical protein